LKILINFDPSLERKIASDMTDLTFEYHPSMRYEDCYVIGEEARLKELVWRYVSPLETGYVTEATADAETREDFDHFWWPVPDYADADWPEWAILRVNKRDAADEARFHELSARYSALESTTA
jgi:hypothetical protein